MSQTVEADIEAGKFTQESVANAKLPLDLQSRVWTLVFDTNARTMFQKLFIEKTSVEERRKRIRIMYSTNWKLHDFVRQLVSTVAEKDPDAAGELAAVLKGESRTAASTVSDTAECQYRQRQSSQTFSVGRFEECEKTLRDDTWIDEWGLPIPVQSDGYPINDGMNKNFDIGNREIAELKRRSLSDVYRGEVMRWNHEDHHAGKYGDPKNSRAFSETGWIIQRPPSAHTKIQEYGRQPSQAWEELTEQRQTQTRGKIIFLSPAHMKVLQIDPELILTMPTPWVLAHRDLKSEYNSIAMQERIDFDAWLKGAELQPAVRTQITMILKDIDRQ